MKTLPTPSRSCLPSGRLLRCMALGVAGMMSSLSTTAQDEQWIDVTSNYIENPGFDGDNGSGWTEENYASSNNISYGCKEFWNGTFDFYQSFLCPNGKYRLSMNGYYRTGDYSWYAYQTYVNGEENITASLYANEQEIPVQSAYAYQFPTNESGTAAVREGGGGGWGGWGGGGAVYYFANNMQSASTAFSRGEYMNELEFEVTDGAVQVGVRNWDYLSNNWCIFDNFKLEFWGVVKKVTGLSFSSFTMTIDQGDQVQLKPVITPSDATFQNLTWESDNESILTVDSKGVVTGLAKGSASVTARTTDGTNLSAKILITVTNNEATADNLIINEVMARNIDMFIDPTTNFGGWIEIYNPKNNNASLNGFYLSDDVNNLMKWRMPNNMGSVPAKGYKVIWFDNSHMVQTNCTFKLDAEGGDIYISDSNGKLLVSQSYPAAIARCSYARVTDGGDSWQHTSTPTLEASNSGSTFASTQLAPPVVDKDGQFFSGTLTVSVNIPSGCTLRYTLDGTTPTLENGETSATGLFDIRETTSLRLRLYKSGFLPSNVVTRSYLNREFDTTLPVVSVVTDPDFLYDDIIGCYVRGTNGRPGNGQRSSCNWNMDWNRPVNFTYISTDNKQLINQDVNFSMCGGWSRAWTPHSFKLKANKLYDIKHFSYDFFPLKPYTRNKGLQLRNGGNDTSCRIKDAALVNLIQTAGFDVDGQAYNPIIHYINGQYVGFLNMRETNNKHYVYANYGWDDDEIDQFEIGPDSGYCQMCGTKDAFMEWYDLSADAANPETYELIKAKVDMDEYINYMATEFYLGGTDWPQNNVKGFRNINDGKFRFVIFDLDHAFSTTNPFNEFARKQTYTFDPLYSLDPALNNTTITKEIEFVTIFLNMLQNEEFCKKFVDTYCLVGGSVFEPGRVKEIVTAMADKARPMMRIEGASPDGTANSVISSLNSRLWTMLNTLRNYNAFNLSNVQPTQVKLAVEDNIGRIFVNDIQVPTNAFDGYLFQPMKIRAEVPAGYTFAGWKRAVEGVTSTIFESGSEWFYNDLGESLDNADWTSSNYNDGNWKKGSAPLGYGKDMVVTTTSYGEDSQNKYPTTYFRKHVTLDVVPDSKSTFTLSFTIDDGLVVYVNGTEAGRYNMNDGNVTYSTYARQYAPNNPDTGTLTLDASLFRKGDNVIAVEVHNCDNHSTDLLWDASLESLLPSSEVSYYTRNQEFELRSTTPLDLIACYTEMSEQTLKEEGVNPVRVNEICASNSIFVNEYNKRNDWVELYNTTGEDIDVEGMYLSDNINKPTKWQITKGESDASTIIPAHGHLIIWCDKLDPATQLHATFKLAAEGGYVTLTAKDESWTDVLYYPPHNGDMSVGRFPDGGKDTYVMNIPTIEKSNVLSSYVTAYEAPEKPEIPDGVSTVIISDNNGLRISYAQGQLAVSSDEATNVALDVFTASGQRVFTTSASLSQGRHLIGLPNLPTGVYMAKAVDDEGKRVACKFILK